MKNFENYDGIIDESFISTAWELTKLLAPKEEFENKASAFYGGIIHILLKSKTPFNASQITDILNKANKKVISELLDS